MACHDLLDRTEALRINALRSLDPAKQATLGQHFTPAAAARLMAGMVDPNRLRARARVLDPGAGTGILLGAVVERLVSDGGVRAIEATAIELDESLIPALRATVDACVEWAAQRACAVVVDIRHSDFIIDERLNDFDIAVMNPPYSKLGRDSTRRLMVAMRTADCPNTYAAFMAAGIEALKVGGQLVSITPRSFANGPYFGKFRHYLLRTTAIERIHTFESRSTVFAETGVLQENVILAATKGGSADKVVLSVSDGHADEVTEHVVASTDVVYPGDSHEFIRLTTSDDDANVASEMASMPSSLEDLGLTVSTGKVVDFRARDNLKLEEGDRSAPLIYPGNVRGGAIEWPRSIRKAQWFEVLTPEDASKALLPSGVYVIVKRFSSKEERRRIVAGIWDPEVNGYAPPAFENHLNVFHAAGHGMDRRVARGLSLWLNSTSVDRFFRTFSGHTQVNATDLRTLRYPTPDTLSRLGQTVGTSMLPAQDEIDALLTAATSPS